MAEATAKGLEGTVGPDHPDTLASLNSLALAYRDVGRLPEAIALFERVRDANIAKLGPDHPDTLTTSQQPRRGVLRRRQAPRGDRPARARHATPGSPSSAPTTPTP